MEQLDSKVNAWVGSIGTGGTLLGVAETLKGQIVTVLVDRRDRYFAEYPHEYYMV